MNSTLKLYKAGHVLEPARNSLIEQLTTYLNSCSSIQITDFQYIKHAKDISIKINYSQSDRVKFPYNYISIQNTNETLFYYFVLSTEWLSTSTIKLNLSMDTINTFGSSLMQTANWSDKTNIVRQHKDRFTNITDPSYLWRKIDRTDEGMSGLNTYKATDDKCYASGDTKTYYLIYKTNNIEDNNPIELSVVSDANIIINDTKTVNTYVGKDLKTGMRHVLCIGDNRDTILYYNTDSQSGTQQVNLNSWSYSLIHPEVDSYAKLYRWSGTAWQPVDEEITSFAFSKLAISRIIDSRSSYTSPNEAIKNSSLSASFRKATSNVYSYTISSIANINRTESLLNKIIEIPYCPTGYYVDRTLQWSDVSNSYEVINVLRVPDTTLFANLSTLTLPLTVEKGSLTQAHNIKYESKLYNSAFYHDVFAYDNFRHEIRLEELDTDYAVNDSRLSIKWVKSRNINSNMLFEITPYCRYKYPIEDYPTILTVNRNNEVAIMTSSYVDYLKNGYNYDVKNKTTQIITGTFGTALNLAGAAGGALLGKGDISAATALQFGTGAVSGVANTITNAIMAERSIKQKLQETANQAVNVSGSDDLDLFDYYSGNKLKHYTYTLSDEVKKSIYDLFRLTGYACNYRGIPNLTGRINYNFVMCEPEFTDAFSEDNWQWLDDIKARFANGITIYHNNNDFEQANENWETWIV